MDLRKLQYFLTVVDAGSLHRASEKLRIAQPALSKNMRALEDALGVQLLIRHSKGVQVTEEGASLYRHATDILAAWKVAEADVQQREHDLGGTVSIGAPPALAQHVFGSICSKIAKTYPRLNLELYEGVGHNLWDELHSERLDIAIIGDTRGSPSIITELVTYENIYLLSPVNWEVPPNISTVEDLSDYPLIVTTRAHSARSWFEELTHSKQIKFNIRYRVESPQIAKELVLRGLGAAVLPRSGVMSEISRGEFKVSLITTLRLARVMACRKERYLHSSVSFIRNELRSSLLKIGSSKDFPGQQV